MSNYQTHKLILLDTDIGSDIDDSLALTYLLKHPDSELLGVTTVSGEPEKRASIVDCLLRQTGKPDIAVHVGIEAPFLVDPRQPKAPHFDILSADSEKYPNKTFDKKQTAIDFLRETIHAHPHQITMLAIGPLTNIAALFTVDRSIPSLLKELIIMGGQHTGWAKTYKSIAEWNILCDPHAAAIVFASDVKITAVGLEVTTQCLLNAKQCEEKLSQPTVPSCLLPMAKHWLGHQEYVTFHDPLAAALIFEPGLCNIDSGIIDVETSSEKASGLTYWKADPRGKHLAASTVNPDAFFDHYFKIVHS